MNALEVQISGFEVERDALRRQAAASSRPAENEVISKRAAAESPTPYETAEHKIVEETGNKGEVSARLIATKMAMDGEERDTIRARLDAYDLEDPDGLLDDVIEKVG